MNVETIQIPKEEAREKWKEYLDALRARKEAVYSDLRSVYGHMKEGRAVLDIHQAFRDTGLLDGGWPKLAIVRADYPKAYFTRENRGRGWFTGKNDRWPQGHGRMNTRKEDIALPHETFRDWRPEEEEMRFARATTEAPLIPAKFLPDSAPRNYYILWEAESWTKVAPPRDPMLLRRLSPNMFVVLSSWDLSIVERSVLQGRIG